MTEIVVVGSSNTDLVIECSRLPGPGETVVGGELQRFPGGKGANQAVAAVRAGARVSFVGARGDDDFGRSARRQLRSQGVGVRHFRLKSEAPSGVALILVGGRSRENIIGVSRSANDCLEPSDVRAAEGAIRKADVVVTQLEIPLAAVEECARLASVHGKPLVLNPGPAPPRALRASLLRRVDTLTPNEQEAEALTREADPLRAARCLIARGCRRVVVTLGRRGALVVDGAEKTWLRPNRVKAVDTVGAGDCFTAWLAVGLAEGNGLVEAARRAAVAAALAVTRRGAQPAMPYRWEIDAGLT